MALIGGDGDFQGQIGNPCDAAEKEIFTLLCGFSPPLSISLVFSVVVTSYHDLVTEFFSIILKIHI